MSAPAISSPSTIQRSDQHAKQVFAKTTVHRQSALVRLLVNGASHIRSSVLLAAALVVVALVLPPFINVNRYKGRVIDSISKAFGRAVTCDSIELRLLPQPGFTLANVTVADDPAYSLEPILHADEMTAYLGLSSLWRDRIEIARVSLNYPSLNLVERDDASWNFQSLLWKASRTRAAPTSAPLSNTRPRFPYIEASNGRINFKYGLEKSFFSFTDADFSLWSPAENQWRMRLEAHPVRTDMPVTDTGTVKAEATIERAEMLRDAPIQASVTWERVQLGNLTRLVYGEDGGWRGALEASAQFSGTPAALHFTSAARLRDFRRFDIASGDAVNLSASCQGELDFSTSLIQHTECNLPLDGGRLSVQGNLHGLHSPRYDLSLSAKNLGADVLLDLARHTKRNMPDDLSATGTVSGSLHVTRLTEAPSTWLGDVEFKSLDVHSAVLGKDLAIAKAVVTANLGEPAPASRRRRAAKAGAPRPAPAVGADVGVLPGQRRTTRRGTWGTRALMIQSFDLPLGSATPVKADGTLDHEGFAVHLKGDATLERLQQFARVFGIGAPKFSLSGPAAIDLVIGGKWSSLNAPQINGVAQLKNARAKVPGLSLPLEIASARAELDGDRLALLNASATLGKISLGGSAVFPRSCESDSPCVASFDLTTDELNPARWNEVLNPHLRQTPWYFFGAREAGGSIFPNLQASGHIAAHRLTLNATAGSAFETNFSFANGILELTDARANLLGGAISGDWRIDFTGSKPNYETSGDATRIQAEKLTPILKAPLGSGALSLNYKLRMAGWDAASLARSAAGAAAFTWTGGALRIAPEDHSPLSVLSGEGKADLDNSGWSISESQWKTPAGVYQLSGRVSRDSALDLAFTQKDGGVWKVSGTLAKPQPGTAAAPPPTQARRR